MWYETDQIVCIIWRFSKTNPLSCHSFCWKSMLHNPFWSLPCPLHGPFRDFKPRGLWLQTKILPWGSWGRWLTLISDPVLWETEQPWKKNMSLQRKTWKNHSKGSMARLSVICIQKNNWHGKQQLVSFQWCHPRTSCWWLLEWSSLLCRS